MPSTSETGHAKNIANFRNLIAFVTGYGATYNPSKAALKLPQLNNLANIAETNLANIVTKNTAYNTAVYNRMIAFEGLKTFSTRLLNALEVTDATNEKVKDAKTFNRKIQGKRAGEKAASPTDPNTPAPTNISISQQSYDQQIQHFAGLVSVLQSEASYAPNEADLQIVALIAKQADLLAKNNAVATAYTSVSNERIARDKTLYNDSTGLVDIATEVKQYIKSIFGANSPEYAQVKGIAFKTVKR